MQVTVRDNNVDQALRVLKKKLQREGVFTKFKQEQAFQSKGEKAREAKKKAIKRDFKNALNAFKASGLTAEEAQQAVQNNEPRPKKKKGYAPRR